MTVAGSRVSLAVAAVLCVTYASTILDTPQRLLIVLPTASFVQPPPPEPRGPRAPLQIEVLDENDALVPGATVSVYLIQGPQAYAAGVQVSDTQGVASFDEIPPGELWILAEAPGRQRSSTRLVLGPEGTRSRLTIRRAQRLVVQVVDEAERAVIGATVEVRGADPLPYVGKSGDKGAVEFTRLGPGPWTVRASLPGYESASKTGVRPGLLPQRLALRSLGALEISVKQPDGTPAPQATVEVAGSGLWPARTALTDEQGRVRIASLPAGAYNAVATRGELASETSLGVLVQRGEPTRLSLQLGQGRRVAVRVTDGDGDDAPPVPRAEVVLAEDGLSSFPRRALTDARGEVAVGPVGLGAAVLGVRAEGFVPRTGIRVKKDHEGPVQVALVRGGRIVGEVVDPRGDPVEGASVEVIGVDFAGMPVDETPEHMSFREVHFAWSLSAPVALVPAGELGVMPGPLPPIPRGRPALVGERATPTLGGSDAVPLPPPPAPWVSGPDGQFRAGPVPPGRLRALVRHPGYVEGLSEAVTVAPGGEAKVRVQLRVGGTLEGRVVDGGGRPVAGARVQVAAVHGTLVRSALTAEDGTFAFAAIPGEISVAVARPDSFEDALVRKEITLGEGERKELELVLPAPREPVEVRVVDERGFPLENAQITALSLTVGVPLRTTRFTRGDGVVQIPDAAGLDLRLEASLSGRALRSETFEKVGRELRVTLGKAASLEGEVVAHRGHDKVEGALVTVTLGGIARSARTSEDGRYLIPGLPAGKGRLSIQAPGFARAERAVVVAEPDGERPSVAERIELMEGGEVEGEVVDQQGDPVVGARVAQGVVPAFLPLGALPPGVVVTDARGRFKLGELPEGNVVIEAFAAGRGRGRATDVQVRPGRPLQGLRIVLDTETSQREPAGTGGVAVTLAERGEGPHAVIYLRAVAAGSEAERAGLEVEDELLRIDDAPPRDLEDARTRLSGPVGEDVVLRVRRRDEELRLRVPRERVRR